MANPRNRISSTTSRQPSTARENVIDVTGRVSDTTDHPQRAPGDNPGPATAAGFNSQPPRRTPPIAVQTPPDDDGPAEEAATHSVPSAADPVRRSELVAQTPPAAPLQVIPPDTLLADMARILAVSADDLSHAAVELGQLSVAILYAGRAQTDAIKTVSDTKAQTKALINESRQDQWPVVRHISRGIATVRADWAADAQINAIVQSSKIVGDRYAEAVSAVMAQQGASSKESVRRKQQADDSYYTAGRELSVKIAEGQVDAFRHRNVSIVETELGPERRNADAQVRIMEAVVAGKTLELMVEEVSGMRDAIAELENSPYRADAELLARAKHFQEVLPSLLDIRERRVGRVVENAVLSGVAEDILGTHRRIRDEVREARVRGTNRQDARSNRPEPERPETPGNYVGQGVETVTYNTRVRNMEPAPTEPDGDA